MVFDDRVVSQLLYAQKIPLELQDVLLVHCDDLYRVEFLGLFVLALVDSSIRPLPDQLPQPVLLIESVDGSLLLFLVLIGVPPQQFFVEKAIGLLETLPPEPVLLLLGLDLQAILGDDLDALEGILDPLYFLPSLLLLIHHYKQIVWAYRSGDSHKLESSLEDLELPGHPSALPLRFVQLGGC